MSHIYLIKDSNDLVSHCKCDVAYITAPGQMDCPWCGCGWLFTCIHCRKAFTFARAVKVKETWNDLARQDIETYGIEVEDDDAKRWVKDMRSLLANVRVGQRYIYLDGLVLPVTAHKINFEGWHSKHSFKFNPQVEATKDRKVIKSILGNKDYWLSTELAEKHDEEE